MKRNIGDTFTFNGKTYIVAKRKELGDCAKCAFHTCLDCDSHHMAKSGECSGEARGDYVDVYFIEKKD